MKVLLPLCLALLAAPIAAGAGLLRPRWAGSVGALLAALTFGAILWSWRHGGGALQVAWAPSWQLHLSFTLDGLAVLYSLLAAGIGCAVSVYAAGYMPRHLHEQHRSVTELIRFYALLLLFMGAMVGLVMAQDVLLLFFFWDLTALTSYFLIGYDRHQPAARAAALMALLVTGITAICLLIGVLLLYAMYQTFALPELIAQARPGAQLTIASLLIILAALAKSAQVPLHFWLPHAMNAPTPVSAYLHSAAMVAAGVFLLGRMLPLLQHSPQVMEWLLWAGWFSMATGGLLALTHDKLKEVLAYSTISQYGYIVVLLSLGSHTGMVAASFYVLAHGLMKSTLFLTAGAVTMATGAEHLSHLGGLGRTMPVLAASSGIAAAGLAGLPLTMGFFKDELFFHALLERSVLLAGLAVLGAALTLAYIWRFWRGIFLGARHHQAQPLPRLVLTPIVVLSGVIVYGGVFPGVFARLAEAAGKAVFEAPDSIALAYHFTARPENLLALTTYTLGVLLLYSRPLWQDAVAGLVQRGGRWGPERLYRASLGSLQYLATRLHTVVVYDLRNRIATILWPTTLLLGVGGLAIPADYTLRVGTVQWTDLPLLLALLLTIFCALTTVLSRHHLVLVLALSAVSFSLVAAFSLLGAPDVALVAVLISTITTLLFLGILALFPSRVLRRQRQAARTRLEWRWPNRLLSLASGGSAFIVAWSVLSHPTFTQSIAQELIRLTPKAHAGNIVTAILADFRGLDTLGEITVVAIALLGVMALLFGKDYP